MSYGRMQEEEERIREEIRELTRRARAIDEQEDELYGEESGTDEIPEELRRRAELRDTLLGETRTRVCVEAERALL